MHTTQGTILLVDDNPYDVEMALHALKEAKVTNPIEVLRDGEEALDYVFCRGKHSLSKAPIALMLLDLKLPKVTGIEVVAQMKADSSTKRIPIVMLTASSHERDVMRSYDLGVNSYIVKPVDFDAFQKTIMNLTVYWLHHNLQVFS